MPRKNKRKGLISISKYSGKSDVFDSLVMIHKYTDEELLNNVKIYIHTKDGDKRLRITCRKDLIPYYAHLVSSAYYDNKERKSVIHITSESWVDREERDMLQHKLNNVLRIYNRCKRKKIEFDVDTVVKELAWIGFDDHIYRRLAIRVKDCGKKAIVDGIHTKMAEYWRKELVKEMINNGVDPIKYGDYERFLI